MTDYRVIRDYVDGDLVFIVQEKVTNFFGHKKWKKVPGLALFMGPDAYVRADHYIRILKKYES